MTVAMCGGHIYALLAVQFKKKQVYWSKSSQPSSAPATSACDNSHLPSNINLPSNTWLPAQEQPCACPAAASTDPSVQQHLPAAVQHLPAAPQHLPAALQHLPAALQNLAWFQSICCAVMAAILAMTQLSPRGQTLSSAGVSYASLSCLIASATAVAVAECSVLPCCVVTSPLPPAYFPALLRHAIRVGHCYSRRRLPLPCWVATSPLPAAPCFCVRPCIRIGGPATECPSPAGW